MRRNSKRRPIEAYVSNNNQHSHRNYESFHGRGRGQNGRGRGQGRLNNQTMCHTPKTKTRRKIVQRRYVGDVASRVTMQQSVPRNQ